MRIALNNGCVLALCLGISLVGCGGGGSAPSAAGGGTSTAPTPPPPPVTTQPPIANPVTFRAEAPISVLSGGWFYADDEVSTNTGTTEAVIFSNRNGDITYSRSGDIMSSSIKMSFTWKPDYYILSSIVDLTSGFFIGVRAPKGSTTISPVTDLIYSSKNQEIALSALQIRDGKYASSVYVDAQNFSTPLNFESANSQDRLTAQEMAANNVRVLALASATQLLRGGASPVVEEGPPPIDRFFKADTGLVGSFLRDNPQTRLFTTIGTKALIESLPRDNGVAYRPKVLDAIVHLINVYADAIGPRIQSKSDAGKKMLGIKGWLSPKLMSLDMTNSPELADKMLLLTAQDARNFIDKFEPLPPPNTGRVFPQPDFFVISPDSTKIIDAVPPGWTHHDTPLWWNDIYFEHHTPAGLSMPITSVSVPQAHQAAISAALNPDQTVEVRSLNGFKGLAWFDYMVRGPNNEEKAARVFVIVE